MNETNTIKYKTNHNDITISLSTILGSTTNR